MRPCALSTLPAHCRSSGRDASRPALPAPKGERSPKLSAMVACSTGRFCFTTKRYRDRPSRIGSQIARWQTITSPLMTAPSSGRLLSRASAAVISLCSGLHDHVANHDAKLRREGQDHMQGIGVVTARAAQALFIDRDRPRCLAVQRERAEATRKRVRVNRLEHVAIGRMTWSHATGEAENLQGGGRQPPPPNKRSPEGFPLLKAAP
jgi:hypothetical protein